MTPAKYRFQTTCLFWLFIIISIVSFASLNIGASLWEKGSLDITSQKFYTLGKETKEWLNNNQHNVYVRFYISEDIEKDYPLIGQYIRRIIKLLEQYKRQSHGKLKLDIVTVVPFSPSEKEAQKQNIRGFADKKGQHNLYLGAVFSNDTGQSYTIPYFEVGRQKYLEHDISRVLSKLSDYKKAKIGVLSEALPVMSSGQMFDKNRDWDFIRQLKNDYDVSYLSPTTTKIPQNYDMVMVFYPQILKPLTLFALDQYLLYGGNILITADPFSEEFLKQKGFLSTEAQLPVKDFLESKGVIYNYKQVIGDNTMSSDAFVVSGNIAAQRKYPLWLTVTPPYINPVHPITNGISKLLVKSAGCFEVTDNNDATATLLYSSSKKGRLVDNQIVGSVSKNDLIAGFEDGDYRCKQGILLEGGFNTMFRAHPLEGTEYVNQMPPFIAESVNAGKLAVLGDSDMFADYNWNTKPSATDIYDFIPYSENTDLLEKLVDYLTKNEKIISVPLTTSASSKKQAIEEIIRQRVTDYYASELDAEKARLNLLNEELSQLQQQTEAYKIVSSVEIIRKENLLQKDIQETENKIKELTFKLENKIKQIQRIIEILNIAVFPLIICLMAALVSNVYFYRTAKQAKEYVSE